MHLRHGEVVANDGDHLYLSAGSAGFIRFADGSKLRFSGVEQIETAQANQAPGIGALSANWVVQNAAAGTVDGPPKASTQSPTSATAMCWHSGTC